MIATLHVLTLIVSAMAGGQPATVHCQSDMGYKMAYTADAAAYTAGRHVYLNEKICRDLDDITATDASLSAYYVAHEMAHLRGETREGWADCEALQTMAKVLVIAGMKRIPARQAAVEFRRSWSTSYVLPKGCPVYWGFQPRLVRK